MKQVKLNQVKKGEFLMRLNPLSTVPPHIMMAVGGLQPSESNVWVKGDYIREAKKFSVTKFSDANREYLMKGDALVWVGFTF